MRLLNRLFIISSRSLLNISCIFSTLVSRLLICNSILFSRFWIIFVIIILNSFSGRFPISSFVWLGGHFSCSFACWVFLCLFILFRLLCLEWAFCILLVCGSFLLWRFLPVGGVDDWLVKVSWSGKLASVFWCLELDFFSLLSKTMGCFSGHLMASASDQKLFCGVAQHSHVLSMNLLGRKWSPRPIPPHLLLLPRGY